MTTPELWLAAGLGARPAGRRMASRLPEELAGVVAPEGGTMTTLADTPVLVGRAEACTILGVTEATFSRLCREGRFENMVCEGRDALYRRAELRAYRAQDKRLGASPGSITNAAGGAQQICRSWRDIGSGNRRWCGESPGDDQSHQGDL